MSNETRYEKVVRYMREWRNDFYATGAVGTDGLVNRLAEEVAAYNAKTLHTEPAKSTIRAYAKEIASMLDDGFLTLEQVNGTWNFSTEHLPTAEFSEQQQAKQQAERAYILSVMPADDVQEYMSEYGFTLEEIQAEYARRREVDAEYLTEQAEEIAQEVSPARSAIASDTCPEAAYRLNLNGKTVDIDGAHGIAASAALTLLAAGAEHQQVEESTRAIVKAATSGEHTAVSIDTPNGVLVFTSSTEN